MSPEALLAEALDGRLSAAAQQAIIEALRDHVIHNADLDRALGLRGEAGRSPRMRVLLDRRDRALKMAYGLIEHDLPFVKTRILHDLLSRRRRARDGAADDIEQWVDLALSYEGARGALSVRQLHDIVG